MYDDVSLSEALAQDDELIFTIAAVDKTGAEGLESDMVAVVMGDEHGLNVPQRQAQREQGGVDAAAGDAGVQQQVGAGGAEEQAVALGAAGQCM